MRHFILFGTITIIFIFISCKKDISSDGDSAAIHGRWNVISDSSLLGAGINNHPVNYTGQEGDYFDFNTNGKLYISEQGNIDTLNYTLISDTTVIIESFGIMLNGIPDTSIITNLTRHSATIITPAIVTPGGMFGRKVNLSR